MTLEIPNYRILEKVGEGAQTRLYRARCTRTGKDYTVKTIKITRPEDSSYVELLRNEHAIGSLLDHPVLRKVYELRLLRHRFRVRGAMLFMEYVEGVSLSDREFDASLPDVLGILGEVAIGLHAMHGAGWVHADLKPSNVLVSTDGKVKLIDFGQSSRIHQAKPRIQGTIDYIAPEQVQRGTLDQRTDVFGLGALLHRVVTGRPIATEMNQTVSLHSQGNVGKRVAQHRPGIVEEVPICVARLIEEACQSRPQDRLPDMPAWIERINLARTILEKRAAGAAASAASAEQIDDALLEVDDPSCPADLEDMDAPPLMMDEPLDATDVASGFPTPDETASRRPPE